VLEIELNGTKTLAIVREVQRNAITDVLEHVDLMLIKRGEKIEADVPIRVEGEPTTGIALLDLQELRVRVEATHVPEAIIVNVDGLNDGDSVRLSGLVLPEGAEAVSDEDLTVVTVTLPRSAEEQEEETTTPAEGEGEEESV
jgi:large subunit ribosomal protein L25